MSRRLTDSELATFHRDGFLTCPEFFGPERLAEVESWVTEISQLPLSNSDQVYHYFEQTDGGPTLARSENFVPHHAGIRRLLTETELVEAISDLFGEPAVLFKEKINYK